MIQVEQKQSDGAQMVFSVSVSDSAGRTQHRVTLSDDTYHRLTGGRVTPVACIEAVFRFLLERQTKGDLLTSFDVNVLQLSHPRFEKEIGNYL